MFFKTLVLTLFGFIFLSIGFIGIILPILPTTPFVLISAVCFSVGNKKIFNLLEKNPIFGQYIENYRKKIGIKKSLKIISIAILWTGLIVSMIIVNTIFVFILLGFIGLCVTIHLLLIKTRIV